MKRYSSVRAVIIGLERGLRYREALNDAGMNWEGFRDAIRHYPALVARYQLLDPKNGQWVSPIQPSGRGRRKS